jgi:hypothetical protein
LGREPCDGSPRSGRPSRGDRGPIEKIERRNRDALPRHRSLPIIGRLQQLIEAFAIDERLQAQNDREKKGVEYLAVFFVMAPAIAAIDLFAPTSFTDCK